MERLKGNDLMSVAPQFTEATSGNSIENVLSSFRTNEGYAQPNRYEVSIFLPRPTTTNSNPAKNLIFNSVTAEDKKEISLRCESVTLPGRNLSSTPDTNVHGPLREVVNNVNFADSIPMVFQASADLRERVFFEKWQYIAFNPKTWNVGYYNDYIGSVEIYLLDKSGQRKYGLRLEECFPKNITQTELSYASNNEIIKLSVDMNFRYWISLDKNQEIGWATGPNIYSRKIFSGLPAVVKPIVHKPRVLTKKESADIADRSRWGTMGMFTSPGGR